MGAFDIAHLTFRYPGAAVPALEDVSLTIEDGAFLVVCGPSGCGKTTLLRHLKPVLSPHGDRTGSIVLDGTPIGELTGREQASRVGFVLQDPDTQIVCDKVWHELAFGLENLGLTSEVIRLRVAEMASYFGIQHWFERPVCELSGGQKQLLNLASVMAMQPRALVLDEPTAQLDPLAAREFLSTLRAVNRDLGTTVILSEHRLEETLPIADGVVVLDCGRIVAEGEPRSVCAHLEAARHPMRRAMPTPARAYLEVEGASAGEIPIPLTVREGRTYLAARAAEGAVAPTSSPVDVGARKRDSVESALELRDVWFRYARDGEDALRDLALHVAKGSWHCILGGNGAGKSTALGIMSRAYAPYRGSVRLFGRDMRRIPAKELFSGLLGVLPQDPQALFVHDTVRADLEDVAGATPKAHALIERVAEQVEIAHLLDRHPFDLSGGERQRAGMAKVLLLRPRVLLLDEPTKGLDAAFKERLARVLERVRADGMTIVMVSHDVEFCASHADTCSLLFRGSVVSTAPAREFFAGNSFYTTVANRIGRAVRPDVVVEEDLVELCGGPR